MTRAAFPPNHDRRSSILLVALSFLLLVASARAADLPDGFDPARDGAADVAHAVALAKAHGKRVIVDVGGEWCSWCHILDRFIAANDDVRALIERNYVWVKVNYSKENRNEALLARWPRIRGYPHLFVLDGDGRLVHSQDTGVLESGKGYDKARVIAFLERFRPAPYQRRTRSPSKAPTVVGTSIPATYHVPRNGAPSSGQCTA